MTSLQDVLLLSRHRAEQLRRELQPVAIPKLEEARPVLERIQHERFGVFHRVPESIDLRGPSVPGSLVGRS
jgi:hypothetical protein